MWVIGPIAILLGLAGCVATATSPPPRGVVVSGPPPAPIHEERPSPPTPNAAWVAGYWHWTGIQYAWIPGHWEASPPPGATWRPPQYVSADGAYFYEAGAWRGATQPAAATPATRSAIH